MISSTPEGEKYFQKQAEILYEKAAAGDLDVEVTPERQPGELVVLEGDDADRGGSHVDVSDLSSEPCLAVKPLRTRKEPPLSSFEALYDTTQIEEVPGDLGLGAHELRPGDKFTGTRPDDDGAAAAAAAAGMSSFENIYHPSASDAGSFLISPGDTLEPLPEVRWSAPADSIEPPMLVKEEFDQRYGAVRDRIEGHFTDITEMVAAAEEGERKKSPTKRGQMQPCSNQRASDGFDLTN